MATFDIIIPTCGKGRLSECVKALRYTERDDIRLMVVDNGPCTYPLLHVPGAKLSVINSPTPYIGIAKALNAGLALSTAPYVVLLNDDVEVVVGWLENMRHWFEKIHGRIGIVSACVDHDGSAVSAKGLGAPRDDGYVQKDIIPFYCVMLSRECIEEVGYFDERFRHGFGFDNDYCERVRKAGFSIAVDLRTVVHHGYRTTTKALYGDRMAEYQQAAEKLLREKWGR